MFCSPTYTSNQSALFSHVVIGPSQFGHRPGVVFGGVAAQSQTPLEDEPDFGRWQEVLVATPGRLFPGVTHRVWREGRHVVFGRHFCGI